MEAFCEQRVKVEEEGDKDDDREEIMVEEESAKVDEDGRNSSKVTQSLNWAAHPNPPPEIPILAVDTSDPSSLRSLAAQTKPILVCVGPFRLYGEPVVVACVKAGCDYLDFCGEPYLNQLPHPPPPLP